MCVSWSIPLDISTGARYRLGLRYGALVHRLRFVIVGIWLLVLAVAAPLAARAGGVLTSTNPAPAGSESARAQALLTGTLGVPPAQVFVVFQSAGTPVSDASYQSQVAGFVDRVSALPAVTSATASGPGADGRTEVVVVDFDRDADFVAQHLGPVRSLLRGGPARAYVTGAPAVSDDFNRITAEDVSRADGVALPIALVVLLVVFGSLVAAPLPLLLAIAAVLTALAAVYGVALRAPVDSFVLEIVSIIGLGSSIDYSLLLVRRHREELARREDVREAVAWTVATAGEAILLGGLTVAIGFVALVLTGVPVLASIGLGGILVILAAVAAALTLLPAILAIAGSSVDAVRLRLPRRPRTASGGLWHRWATAVMRRPVPVAVAAVALLAAVAWPVLRLNTGSRDATAFPAGVESRQGLEILSAQFPGVDPSPVQVVVQTVDGSSVASPAAAASLASLTRWLGTRPTVSEAAVAATAGDTALVTVRTSAPLDSAGGRALIDEVRAGAAARAPGLRVLAGGAQAESVDFVHSLYARFPLAVAFVLGATYVLLLLMFRSALLPLKAVLMNALSVAAAYGVLVLVFQWGAGASLLGITATGLVDHLVPVLLFCVLFGVSMDYEVFLLSRVREAWLETGDNRLAVALGLERTGGVITSAALLFCVVTISFVFTRLLITKEIGVGITAAILLDAIVVRALLVPATMCLLGRLNWWLPGRRAVSRARAAG
jgi:RND superfamily putative drug exporter